MSLLFYCKVLFYFKVLFYCKVSPLYKKVTIFKTPGTSKQKITEIPWKHNERYNGLEEKIACLILQIKSRSARRASHHLAFMGNFPIISHTFLALSIQWISSPPSRIGNVESVQNFTILFCVWCESRELGGRGSSKFSCATPVVEISDTVAFTISSNISDGAPL